jgi:hypothetical protein
MKRIVLIMILGAAITFANAQATKTTSTTKTSNNKSTTTAITKSTASNSKTQTSTDKGKSMIQTSELQKAITENISKDYPDYKVLQAYKISENNNTNYEIVVEKGNIKEDLFYNKDGKFLKKESPVEKPKAKMPAIKPVQKTTTTKQSVKK